MVNICYWLGIRVSERTKLLTDFSFCSTDHGNTSSYTGIVVLVVAIVVVVVIVVLAACSYTSVVSCYDHYIGRCVEMF